jgi:O-antigen/teichoic acid export membrane protein
VRIRRRPAWGRGGSRVGRDGAALMVSTVAVAGSSLLFWIVAARRYPTDSVGEAAAEIATLNMLAGFSQLNLFSVFVRFLAGAGNRVMKFLTAGYLAIVGASVVLGSIFVLIGLGAGFLGSSWWDGAAFVVAVAVFAMFVVQDGVLTAFTKAPWVPIENLAVALTRLGLLLILIPAGAVDDRSRLSIVWAWWLPTLLAVVTMSVLIFSRLAPEQARRSRHRSSLPSRRQFTSFVLAEYLYNLVNTVVCFVPPVLVLHLLGARAAAYFNLPWLIAVITQTLLWNIGMSFVAESTRRPEHIAAHLRHALRLGIGVVVAVGLVLFAGAPVLLGLQGQDFADEGTLLLRLLALSFPFTAVVIMYSLVASLERRLWPLVGVSTLAATAFILAVLGVSQRWGLWSVGLIYLLVQAALAASLLRPLIVRLRSGAIRLPELAPGVRMAET